MAKHLSEDEVTLVVNAKADKAQQNIRKFSKEIDNLGERNKSLQRQMESLELAGKKNTDSWKQRREEYGRNSKQIRNLKQQIAAETKALDLNALTMAQLRQQARSLQRQLDNTSKTINPEDWKKLSSRLSDVRERMGELSDASKSLVEKYTNPQTTSFFRGELFIRFAGLVGKALQKVKEFAAEGISMAETADGVIHAFQKLDNPNLLQTLRKATKNTVDDIELMKAAIKARDFGIPLEDLGKYLSFAQLKAQETGQSLDYMVDSIVTGLGRQSPQILDNLGLSAAEISAKTKETGDFMKAVAGIVENNLAQAGETYISAADRAAQKTAELHNRQLELGQALLPLREKISNTFDTMKLSIMGCIVWLFQHRNASIALGFALTALTISMTALNTAFRTWIAQTNLAKVVVAGWTATTTTLKGIYLLVAAAINTMTGNTVRATAQMRLFNIACKSNVILLLVTALVAAGVAFYAYMNKTTEAQKALVDFNLAHAKVAAEIKKQNKDIEKQVNESTASEITKIKMLQSTIHDTSKSYAERKKAIKQMQSIVPSYHASITKEGRLFNENTAAIDTYIRNLRRAARAEAAYEKMKANEIKILNDMDTLNDARQKRRNVRGAAGGRGVNLNEGERVEARHEFVKAGANSMAKTYYVVVNKAGKVLREINEETAKLIMQDQQMNNMFDDRVKRAQDRIDQYTKQNEFLEKIIQDNGGVGQKFTPKDLNHNPNAVTTPSKGGGSHSTKTTPTKTDPDDKPINAFNNNRAEDIEEAKNAYQEDLNALNEALAMKKIKQEEYNAYISALNIQHQNNLLAIEASYQGRAQEMDVQNVKRKEKIQEEQNTRVEAQKQAALEAYIQMEKQYYGSLEQLQKMAQSSAPQTLQQELETKLMMLEGYYKTSLQMAGEDAARQLEVAKAYEAAKAQITTEYAKKLQEQQAQARQQYGLETFEEHRLQLRQQYGLASQQEIFDAEMAMLKQHLDNKEITEAEYEEAKKNLKIQKAKEAFDYFANLAGGAVKALQDAEMANVDAKYDAEIESAKQAGKDTSAIEKKKAEEKLKIQKKYADVDFAIKASQIIADTSVAIMRAYDDLPLPAAIAASVLIGATGIAQLAAANAERQKVKRMSLNGGGGSGASASGARVATGLESGGSVDVEREQDGKRFHAAYDPNRRGFIDKPTVIVGEGGYGHSKEWVASNAAVENPTIAPILDIMDRAQRAGNIRTLDMNKFLLQQAQGRAAGGSVTKQAVPTISQAYHGQDAEVTKRLIELLEDMKTNGVRSIVGLTELDAKQQLQEQIKKVASK